MDSGFDELSTSCNICVCGRSFGQPGALLYHQRSCKKTKMWLAGALSKAKDVWAARKRHCLEVAEDSTGVESEVHISLWLFLKLTLPRSAINARVNMKWVLFFPSHLQSLAPPLKYFIPVDTGTANIH
jgi:hypothetical protein